MRKAIRPKRRWRSSSYMTSDEVQRRLVQKLRMLPGRKSAWDDPLFESDPTLAASRQQLENGRLMPVATELRAVWDGMRPSYQALLGGACTPEAAAKQMQQDAITKIALMHRKLEPGRSVAVLQVCLVWDSRRRSSGNCRISWRCCRDWRRNRIAYLFAMPAVIVVFAVIVFPFFYNLVLSLSDMSLVRFQDWRIVGLQNYAEVLTDPMLWGPWGVFMKTLVWTVVNVAFHVGLGVLLAVALNAPLRGRAPYRLLLIIPWAVPAYITALTLARHVRL